jgi:hypothetical protein
MPSNTYFLRDTCLVIGGISYQLFVLRRFRSPEHQSAPSPHEHYKNEGKVFLASLDIHQHDLVFYGDLNAPKIMSMTQPSRLKQISEV